MRKIAIVMGDGSDAVKLTAKLRDTPTADAIWAALPISGSANTWGDEVYFDIGVSCALESDAKTVLNAGEIAYWAAGNAIAIGYGPTPVSVGDEIRLISDANVWADAVDDVAICRNVSGDMPVTVSAV
ncbi:MAG: cyclophilin-like fold protein [Pseudomonadota bacterium]